MSFTLVRRAGRALLTPCIVACGGEDAAEPGATTLHLQEVAR